MDGFDIDTDGDDGPITILTPFVRQLLPAKGYRYVLATISPNDGETKLEAKPLSFLAVISLVTKTYDTQQDVDDGYYATRHQENVIGGIVIEGGRNMIVTLRDDCGGLLAPGEDASDCIGSLGDEFVKHLPQNRRRKTP